MYSKEHAVVSAVVGVLAGVLVKSPHGWPVLAAYAAVLGTAIDVDHFLLARLNTGDWSALRRCVRNPSIVFVAQDDIFDTTDVLPLQRVFSHVVIGGVVVAVLYPLAPFLAAFSGVVLYVHLLSDLAWDHRRLADASRQHAAYLEEHGDCCEAMDE